MRILFVYEESIMSEQTPSQHVMAGEPGHHAITDKPVAEHHAPPATHVFSKAELDYFHAEDFAAGKAVVLLMVGIFSTGVVLYSIVAGAVMM
jgi:hypothetical protein